MMDKENDQNQFNSEVSLFSGVGATLKGKSTIKNILSDIQSGKFKDKIFSLRKTKDTDEDKYQETKKSMISATMAGFFSYRNLKGLEKPSGFFLGDIDHVQDLARVRESICNDPLTAFCFVSPGGDGLKVGIKINPNGLDNKKYHAYFRVIQKHVQEKHGVSLDEQRKDVSGLCFMSYDPNLFINPKSEIFPEPKEEPRPEPKQPEKKNQTANVTAQEKYCKAALEKACGIIRNTPEGSHARNGTLNDQAFGIAQIVASGGLLASEAEAELLAAGVACGLSEHEAHRTIKSAFSGGLEKPRDLSKIGDDSNKPGISAAPAGELPKSMEEMRKIFNPARDTDQGNSERLLSKVREEIRFTREAGWMLWSGKKWIADDTAVKDLARETILETIMEQVEDATQARNTNLTRELAYWWKRSENETKISGALAMTEGVKGVYVKKADFDKDQMLFNAQNGIIDLKTGTLRPHDPAALMTRVSTVAYDQNADCPLFKKFLSRIMGESQGLIDFLQKAIGYTLSGEVKEQCWFFLYGRGQNGKSTLIDVISKLMGEYTGKTGIETFLPKHQQQAGNTPEIAALDGARFVYASETEEGKALAAGRIKDMTGGEQISATPKYRDPYSFYPVWKIWISGNHKPTIKDTTISTWRRIRMIPFSVQIPEGERDPDLPAKLAAELPGILRWAVDGCLAWQRNGLKPSKEILAATAEYQKSQDILATFISECCFLPEKAPWAVKTSATNLYDAYKKWCDRSGEREKSQTKFGEALSEKGFNKGRDGRGAIVWEGIGLLETVLTSEHSEHSEPISKEIFRKSSIGTFAKSGSDPSDPSDNDDEEEIL